MLLLETCEIRLRGIGTPDVRALAEPGLLRHIRNNVLLDLSKVRDDGAQHGAQNEDPSEGHFMSKLVVPKFFSSSVSYALLYDQ
jgi:hypothetical protein